jgi:uncharacterized CHY-type Zn-finger protein
MIQVKGKGLTLSEKEVFEANEEFFGNDFATFVRTLTDPQDVEFAVLRRRYQGSYLDLGRHHCYLTHQFSSLPQESPPPTAETLWMTKELEFEVDFRGSEPYYVLLSEGLGTEYRLAIQQTLLRKTKELNSLVKALNYLDNFLYEVLISAHQSQTTPPQVHEASKVEVQAAEVAEVVGSDFEEMKEVSLGKKGSKPKAVVAGSKHITERQVLKAKSLAISGIKKLNLKSLSVKFNCRICRTQGQGTLTQQENDRKITLSQVCFNCQATIECSFESFTVTRFTSAELGYFTWQGCKDIEFSSYAILAHCECNTGIMNWTPTEDEREYAGSCKACRVVIHLKLGKVSLTETEENSLRMTPGGLPSQGGCTHFKGSFRWYCFPCCSRMFPCSKCHDSGSTHALEWATRIVCGFCSEEQNFTNYEPCVSCGAQLHPAPKKPVKKKGGKHGGHQSHQQRTR